MIKLLCRVEGHALEELFEVEDSGYSPVIRKLSSATETFALLFALLRKSIKLKPDKLLPLLATRLPRVPSDTWNITPAL